MDNLRLEEFVETYIDSVIEVIKGKDSLGLNDFYSHIFGRVSEITGLSQEKVRDLHHAFHWALFITKKPYLEIFIPKGNGSGYKIKQKEETSLEKSELVKRVFGEYGIWLRGRWNNSTRSA